MGKVQSTLKQKRFFSTAAPRLRRNLGAIDMGRKGPVIVEELSDGRFRMTKALGFSREPLGIFALHEMAPEVRAKVENALHPSKSTASANARLRPVSVPAVLPPNKIALERERSQAALFPSLSESLAEFNARQRKSNVKSAKERLKQLVPVVKKASAKAREKFQDAVSVMEQKAFYRQEQRIIKREQKARMAAQKANVPQKRWEKVKQKVRGLLPAKKSLAAYPKINDRRQAWESVKAKAKSRAQQASTALRERVSRGVQALQSKKTKPVPVVQSSDRKQWRTVKEKAKVGFQKATAVMKQGVVNQANRFNRGKNALRSALSFPNGRKRWETVKQKTKVGAQKAFRALSPKRLLKKTPSNLIPLKTRFIKVSLDSVPMGKNDFRNKFGELDLVVEVEVTGKNSFGKIINAFDYKGVRNGDGKLVYQATDRLNLSPQDRKRVTRMLKSSAEINLEVRPPAQLS